MLDDFYVRALAWRASASRSRRDHWGAFVVWRRMAYFGDATAHAAILGVALVAGDGPADRAWRFGCGRRHGADGDVSCRAVPLRPIRSLALRRMGRSAIGLVAVSLSAHRVPSHVETFLFGEILAVGRTDLAVIWGGALVVCLPC